MGGAKWRRFFLLNIPCPNSAGTESANFCKDSV